MNIFLNIISWIFIQFIRTLLGIMGFGGVGAIVYLGYKDWPTPLYAAIIMLAIGVIVFVIIDLYCKAEERIKKL